ncbi:MarR family winged helix-turn-helix transcriptional regulator [Microlunatus speluncae]|uniref:MarR family winged helix-turn-helix transcriptional regulator n=1 Tax=Microlunatus speluncae TaxID=2594267 RepID=UPI001FE39DC0|nr:MarR family transcriptional regulator [Microlunatus speluncae]
MAESIPAEVEEPDLLALEQQVCFALAVASRTVIGLYRPILEPMGLTHPQYLVMLALWQHGSLSLRELTDLVSNDAATLSPLVRRLAESGYVRRDRDPDDERSLRISLTPRGRRLRQKALDIPPTIMKKLDMDLAEVRRVHASLTDLIKRATTDAP